MVVNNKILHLDCVNKIKKEKEEDVKLEEV